MIIYEMKNQFFTKSKQIIKYLCQQGFALQKLIHSFVLQFSCMLCLQSQLAHTNNLIQIN